MSEINKFPVRVRLTGVALRENPRWKRRTGGVAKHELRGSTGVVCVQWDGSKGHQYISKSFLEIIPEATPLQASAQQEGGKNE